MITTEFPHNSNLKKILRDKIKEIKPEYIERLQNHLIEEFLSYVLKWIELEFEYSAGALALSHEEFIEYFNLEKGLATTIIDKLLESKWFVLEKSDEDPTEIVERLQIDFRFSQNYWIKSELVQSEADTLLEIGPLLKTAFNSGIKHLTIKNQHLIKLDLRGQKLGKIPECIGDFPHLGELNLQSNLIESLPETIGELTSLRYLDLDSNIIKSLPESIGNLKNLEELWVRSNKLTTLPNSIGELINLRKISIASNHITSIPKSLEKLLHLNYFDFRDNPVDKNDSLKKLFPNVYFPKGPQLRVPPNALVHQVPGIKPKLVFFPTDTDLITFLRPQHYQIFVLGYIKSGKTSLLDRKLKDVFSINTSAVKRKKVQKHKIKDSALYKNVDQSLLTINFEKERPTRLAKLKTLLSEDKNCFEFWKIEEEELLTQLEIAFFQGCDGIILCVDLADQKSINKLISTMDQFITLINIVNKDEIKKIPILMVGTKGDIKNIQAESKLRALCKDLQNTEINLVSFNMNTNLRFFCEWNKPRQAKFPISPNLWISTSAKTGENVSLAFKIIQIATKEQKRANDLRRVFFSIGETKTENGDLAPFPYVYYFPYPKGPPAGSGHRQAKKVICPYCDKLIDYLSKSCPFCGIKLT